MNPQKIDNSPIFRLLSLAPCTIDFAFELILSLFSRKKEKQKKLAAAEKYAKIMILSLNKKNSLRSDSFLFLTLQTHNFLTLFLRGGRDYYQDKYSIKNESLLTVVR